MTELSVEKTAIDGLLVVRLPVHADGRGWFKEQWQREKMVALGLPDFRPVQQNLSHNDEAGATRGLHAEPWNKLVGVAIGRAFAAWVDLRPGPGFGTTVTLEMGIDTAVYVPRGVANSYQALQDGTCYTYLVDAHWSPEARSEYTYVNLFDPRLAIPWPIPREEASVSEADLHHPLLADVEPMAPPRAGTVVLGANGQVGRALARRLPDAVALGREELDIADAEAVAAFDFGAVGTVINAAGYTNVDGAETPDGRRSAWAANATAVGHLAAAARRHGFQLVHVSSDYVFDGTTFEHDEDEPPSPLGAYGQTKAAGDLAARSAPGALIVRPSWVIGDGHNFVATMASLADRGVSPKVIDDAHGRLSFAEDIADGIAHLVQHGRSGTYNLTNSGPTMTWYDIARRVFELRGRDPDDVTPVTTAQYNGDRPGIAPRPVHSLLNLDRLAAAGYLPADAETRLAQYVRGLD